jgi:hypothetical protein
MAVRFRADDSLAIFDGPFFLHYRDSASFPGSASGNVIQKKCPNAHLTSNSVMRAFGGPIVRKLPVTLVFVLPQTGHFGRGFKVDLLGGRQHAPIDKPILPKLAGGISCMHCRLGHLQRYALPK